jgi:hypothetical protein
MALHTLNAGHNAVVIWRGIGNRYCTDMDMIIHYRPRCTCIGFMADLGKGPAVRMCVSNHLRYASACHGAPKP